MFSFCKICDGENDCGNGDDEDSELCKNISNTITKDKPCPWPRQQRCSVSKICIDSDKVCNGVQDCPGTDDSDERMPVCDREKCHINDHIWCKDSVNNTDKFEKFW